MKLAKRNLREAASLLTELEKDPEMLAILGTQVVTQFIDPGDILKQFILILKNVFHYHPTSNEVKFMEDFLGTKFSKGEINRYSHYAPDAQVTLLTAVASEYMHRFIRRKIF